jgi:hypothetical protein
LDVGVGESNGSAVVGGDVWDLFLADSLGDNLAELESGLLGLDSVGLESSLNIEENSEVLVGLLNGDNVHLTKRVSVVSSDLSVDSDETLLVVDDLSGFISGESILESLLEENVQGDALSESVRTRRRSGSVNSLEFSKIPALGCRHSLDGFSLTFVAHFVCFCL